MQKLDFTRLLGFGVVADELAGRVDFQHSAVEAKLGAKVGTESMVALDSPSHVDFQGETFGARLGAKVGIEPTTPAKGIDFKDDTFGSRLGAKVGEVEAV